MNTLLYNVFPFVVEFNKFNQITEHGNSLASKWRILNAC